MSISYPALKTELETDPLAYGYAPKIAAGDDVGLALLLNTIRDGSGGFPAIVVKRTDIASSEVLEAVDNRDFISNPNPAHVAWFESVTQLPIMRLVNDDGSNTRVLGNLSRLIGNTNGSTTRLSNIANRNGSRAEQLFGTGTTITDGDIAKALRGT